MYKGSSFNLNLHSSDKFKKEFSELRGINFKEPYTQKQIKKEIEDKSLEEKVNIRIEEEKKKKIEKERAMEHEQRDKILSEKNKKLQEVKDKPLNDEKLRNYRQFNTKLSSSLDFRHEFEKLNKMGRVNRRENFSYKSDADIKNDIEKKKLEEKIQQQIRDKLIEEEIKKRELKKEEESKSYLKRLSEKNKRLKEIKGKTLDDKLLKNYRQFNTILASTLKFRDEFKLLKIDRTTGKLLASSSVHVPEKFDGRVIWKDYIYPPRDQGLCGGCWAFAVTSVMASRLSIYTRGKYKLRFSPAFMILCNLGGDDEYQVAQKSIEVGNPYDYNLPQLRQQVREDEKIGMDTYGCNGETLIGGWQYAYRFGLIDDNCSKYENNTSISLFNYNPADDIGTCSDFYSDTYDVCPDTKTPIITHLCGGYYYVSGVTNDDSLFENGSELDIRRDIYKWGPTSSALKVYTDLLDWNKPNEVYKWDGKSKLVGGHAISIEGWGETEGDDKVKYWIVKNSWGPKWNGDGYFKILRGENECEIEENVFVGFPNLFGIRLYIEWPLLYRTEDFTIRLIWGISNSGYKATTYEKLITGKLAYDSVDFKEHPIDEDLYLKDYWPDVSTLIAAEPDNIIFRLADTNKKAFTLKKVFSEISLVNFVIYALLFLLLIFIIYKIVQFLKIVRIKIEFIK